MCSVHICFGPVRAQKPVHSFFTPWPVYQTFLASVSFRSFFRYYLKVNLWLTDGRRRGCTGPKGGCWVLPPQRFVEKRWQVWHTMPFVSSGEPGGGRTGGASGNSSTSPAAGPGGTFFGMAAPRASARGRLSKKENYLLVLWYDGCVMFIRCIIKTKLT